VDGPAVQSWAFRGQADASWPLSTALSRYLLNSAVHPEAWAQQEQRILRIFQRKAHLFLPHVPAVDDTFEWLALMQHHGAPTRLLDLTWSPYVAAFFALERATSDAVVWAISPPRVREHARGVLEAAGGVDPAASELRRPESYETIFLPGTFPIVYIGEPYMMNQRLVAQEGTFAVPGVLQRPLEDVLSGAPGEASIVRIVLRTSAVRREAMRSLYNMNITHATLFPDLDGLARSMAYELEFHWAFDPYTMERTPGFE
jgi:hypothetical protein